MTNTYLMSRDSGLHAALLIIAPGVGVLLLGVGRLSVIGKRKVFYDVWGNTVNMAARMESYGEAGRIQITAETRASLGDSFVSQSRGTIDIKGKGPFQTWWLTGRA